MSLNESIIKIRVELQKRNIKKSGLNKFAGFGYFELSDFLPTLNELMLAEKVNDQITIDNNVISLALIKGEERQVYSMPFVIYDTPMNNKGGKSMQDIQYLGALNTYYKRYLYLNAFGITDGEIIDTMDNTQQTTNQNQNNQNGQNKSYKPTIQLTQHFMDLKQKLVNVGINIELDEVKEYIMAKTNVKDMTLGVMSHEEMNIVCDFMTFMEKNKKEQMRKKNEQC